MMEQKKTTMTMLLGGGGALALRLWQTFAGFEQDTGLAVDGHLAAVALVAALTAVAAALWLLCRRLPGGTEERTFGQAFFTESANRLTVLVMGIFTMAAGGGLQLFFGLMGGGLQSVMQDDGMMYAVVWLGETSPLEVTILGVLAIVSAVCLFPAVIACRRGEEANEAMTGGLLLVPVICVVVRLVMMYRINSVNPVLQGYYVEMLALTFIILALYQLAGYAYGQGKSRRYALCSALAVVFCMATLGDGHDISGTLFYAGGGLSVLGFWLLYRPAGDSLQAGSDASES